MRAALLPLLVLGLLAASGAAGAHAILQSADPPPNGHAPAGTTRVEIRFSESVEHEYTDADVFLTTTGQSVKAGPVEFTSQRNVVLVPVEPLEDGVYSVSWRALSVDSHTTRGTFLFAAGSAEIRIAFDPQAHDHSEHSWDKIYRDGFAKAVFYAGLFLAIGMPLFALVVDRGVGLRRNMLTTATLFAILGASAAALGIQFLAQRIDLPFGATAATSAGKSLAIRGVLLGAAGLAFLLARHAPPTPRRSVAILGVLLAGGALVATSFGSHAAAVADGRAASIGTDILHLATGAVWVGGVVGFIHTSWRREPEDLGRAIHRFSPLAMGSVALLLLTGTYASVRHVPCLTDGTGLPACIGTATEEGYVAFVLLKLSLLVPLVILGAYNQRRLGPALRNGTGSPALFRRVVQVEALVLAAVILAAGVLASTPPPDVEVEASSGPAYVEHENTTRTTHVVLQVYPNPPTVGLQRLVVQLHSLTGPLPNGTSIALKVGAPGEGEPDTTFTPDRIGPETWSAEDAFFTSPGEWTVWVLMQRADEYKKIPFQIEVAAQDDPDP